MAESADATDSKSVERKFMRVRPPLQVHDLRKLRFPSVVIRRDNHRAFSVFTRIKLRLIASLEKNPNKNRKKENRPEFDGFWAEILSAVQGARKRRRWSVFNILDIAVFFLSDTVPRQNQSPKQKKKAFDLPQGRTPLYFLSYLPHLSFERKS